MTTTTDSSRQSTYALEEPRRHRSAAAGGFAFVALSVTANFLPGAPPASDDSAAKVAAYFKDNAGGIKAAQFLGGLGIVALLWWFGSLWRMMSRAEGERPQLAIVAALSLGIGLALAIVSGTFTTTAAIRIDSIGEGSQLLWSLSLVGFAGASFALFAFLGSVCALSYRTKMLPAWTNYVAGLAAVAFLAGSVSVTTDANAINVLNVVAFLVWCVWIVAVSAVMWRGAATAA